MKNVRCIFYASLQCWKASSVSDALKSCLRSSYQMCSIIKGVLTNFAKFTGKHPCQSLSLNKVAVPFLRNTSGWLLLLSENMLTNFSYSQYSEFLWKTDQPITSQCYISVPPCGFWITTHKKWSFPWRISSENVTRSAVSCGFGHIYWKNPYRKTSFFVQWMFSEV